MSSDLSSTRITKGRSGILHARKTDVEKRLAKLYKKTPRQETFDNFVGTSSLTQATTLGLMGDPARLPEPNSAVKLAGLDAPVVSGRGEAMAKKPRRKHRKRRPDSEFCYHAVAVLDLMGQRDALTKLDALPIPKREDREAYEEFGKHIKATVGVVNDLQRTIRNVFEKYSDEVTVICKIPHTTASTRNCYSPLSFQILDIHAIPFSEEIDGLLNRVHVLFFHCLCK